MPRERDRVSFPPEYSHVLPLDFRCAELRALVTKLTLQLRDEIQRGGHEHLVKAGLPGAAYLDPGRGGSGQ